MAPTIEQIVKNYDADPAEVEWITCNPTPMKMEIQEPNPAWPETFAKIKATIVNAIGDTAEKIEHTGSTSVPGLPAKNIIDIDLTVSDASNEAAYAAQLQAAGFLFILREPSWNEHRLFRTYDPPCNLHVFGPDAAEPVRHRIFRDWMLAHPDDLELYAETKRNAAAESSRKGETMIQYTARKESVILEILQRAFKSLGYVE